MALAAPATGAGLDGRHRHRRHRQVRHPGRRRRATPTWRCRSAAPYAADTFETGTRAAAWGGTTTIVDFAIQSMGAHAARGPGRLARQGRGQLRDRLRLPHDHGRRQRGLAQGDGGAWSARASPASSCSWPTPACSTATTGKILRALQKGAETGGLIMMHAENGIAIDVLVEQALARGPAPTRATTAMVRHALLEAEATHRAIKLAQVAERADLHRPPVGDRRRWPRSARPATRATTRSPRRARSTSSCPPTTSRGRTSRAPSTSARRRCAPRSTRPRCGGGCAPTTCRWCPPTTARSASRGRRSWASATSPRSPTGCRASSTGWTCCTPACVDGHISRRRWIEIACATPARMFGLYPRKGTIAPGSDADVVIYDPNAKQVLSARDAPHGRRLLLLRGQARSPGRSRRCSPAGAWSSTATPTPAPRATGSSCAATRAGYLR